MHLTRSNLWPVAGTLAMVTTALLAFGAAPEDTSWARDLQRLNDRPQEQLAAVQDLVNEARKVYDLPDPSASMGSGFKPNTVALPGGRVIAFAGTEGVPEFLAEVAKEARGLAGVAKIGGAKLALALLAFNAVTGNLPEVPPDVKTDIEVLVGIRPLQFVQAHEYVERALGNNAPVPVDLPRKI